MRIFLFVILLYVSTCIPGYAFFGLAILYALRYKAYELLVIGVLVDSFYGSGVVLPYYTMVLAGTILTVEWLKPYLRMYAASRET